MVRESDPVGSELSAFIAARAPEGKKKIFLEYLDEVRYVDELTGLWNRRYVDGKLPEELEMSCRLRKPVSLFLADMDGLKAINDTEGHERGDEALRLVAEDLRNNLRKTDIVGRYGKKADEFATIMRASRIKGAYMAAEEIRALLEDEGLPISGGVASSDIVGVPLLYGKRGRETLKRFVDAGGNIRKTREFLRTYARLSKSGKKRTEAMLTNIYNALRDSNLKFDLDKDHEEIAVNALKRYADMALYFAKENGRNRIVAYGEDGFGGYTKGGVWVPFEMGK